MSLDPLAVGTNYDDIRECAIRRISSETGEENLLLICVDVLCRIGSPNALRPGQVRRTSSCI